MSHAKKQRRATSGDVAWWYVLPMYRNLEREARRCRIERDHFQQSSDYYATEFTKLIRDKWSLEYNLAQVERLHEGSPEARFTKATKLLEALRRIHSHSDGERKNNEGWCEAFSDIRNIASEAIRELVGK